MNRYLIAALLVGTAFAVRAGLDPLLGDNSPFLIFTLAVLLAGGMHGVGPGVFAAVASTLLGLWAFVPTPYGVAPLPLDAWASTAVFGLTSAAILVIVRQLGRARSEEAASEEAKHQSETREQRLIDAAEDFAIYELDQDGRILTWNRGAERLKGWTAEEIIGREYHVLHTPEQRAYGFPGRELKIAAETGRYEEEAARMRKDGSVFTAHVILFPIRDEGGETTGFVKITRDITEKKANEEAQALLAREVDHRAKNAMAVAQALVSMTKASSVDGFAQAVRGRLAALSRAHSLLSQHGWRGGPLEEVIKDELASFARSDRVHVSGPPLHLNPHAIHPLSLMFHELATNAVRHGALAKDGTVSVTWSLSGNSISIEWREAGGSKASPPAVGGFGTKLIQQVSARQLGAHVAFDWRAEGLVARVDLPKALLTDMPLSQTHAREPVIPAAADPVASNDRDADAPRILLVEDEELIAIELQRELRQRGWSIIGHASTLSEAEDLLSTKSVDAAVLDVNLRGTAVYPFAETLTRRQIPFVFCTGYGVADPKGGFPNVPILQKPCTPAAVSGALAGLLRRAPSGAYT